MRKLGIFVSTLTTAAVVYFNYFKQEPDILMRWVGLILLIPVAFAAFAYRSTPYRERDSSPKKRSFVVHYGGNFFIIFYLTFFLVSLLSFASSSMLPASVNFTPPKNTQFIKIGMVR